MSADRAAVLGAATDALARGSKSFALATRLFDRRTRERVILLYSWCRHCDDVIDGQLLGEGRVEQAGSPAERLRMLEDRTDRALAGVLSGESAFDALALVARDVDLPARYAHDLLRGFAIDVEGMRFTGEAELMRYCYHVAGCVGLMMALLMDVPADDRETLVRASDLGLSFQLNNIARDVVEDAGIGRCYLPESWLAEEGLSPTDHALPENAAALHRVVGRLVALAERYEDSARHGVAALSARQGWAILAAARIYGDIGRKLRSGGPEALAGRTRTTAAEKLAAVAAALPLAIGRRAEWPRPWPGRGNLWTPDI